ncbi:MAG: hypothetical protein K1W22_02325 [Lachnospiraceae bacterium]
MKFMEKYGKLIAMSAAALCMTAALTIESSLAYFTTYVSAGGGGVVNLGSSTVIDEEVEEMTKLITITNPSDRSDCFVRVKVFSGTEVTATVSGDGNWRRGENDYWYYTPVLPAGASTTVLNAKINVPEGFDKDNFNVVVVQECTPVVYDEDGNETADWNTVIGGEDDWKEAGE